MKCSLVLKLLKKKEYLLKPSQSTVNVFMQFLLACVANGGTLGELHDR
jgi:hypothetical protein